MIFLLADSAFSSCLFVFIAYLFNLLSFSSLQSKKLKFIIEGVRIKNEVKSIPGETEIIAKNDFFENKVV